MRFDAHAHIASWPNVEECERNLIEGMDKYHFDGALVTSCDTMEYIDSNIRRRNKNSLSAIEGFKQVYRLHKKYPEKIFCGLWVNPHNEKVDERLKEFIGKYRKDIYCIKVHPSCSCLKISDKRLLPYVSLAREFDLPMLFHTAMDKYANIGMLKELALKNPDIKFVAAHLELLTDNKFAIECLKEAPNLYADTAWVPLKSAKKVLKEVGKERIFFGSDNPIDGLDTLNNKKFYRAYYKNSLHLDEESYERLMLKNAIEFYKIPLDIKKSH